MKNPPPRFIGWLLFALMWAGSVQAGYTINGDGTVTDNVTDLTWDRCAWGQSGADCLTGSASTHTWSQALGVAVTANSQNGGVGYKNHNDWRLPSRTELVSLVNYAASNPAIDATFPATPTSWFWSSTILEVVPAYAWLVASMMGSPSPTSSPTTTTFVSCVADSLLPLLTDSPPRYHLPPKQPPAPWGRSWPPPPPSPRRISPA